MSETSEDDAIIEIDKMSVDQFAGAVVLILGAVGSLLLVIWQSKCHCKVNLCYLFQCERRPPNEDEMKSLKNQAKKMNKKEEVKKEQRNETQEVQDEKLIPNRKLSREISKPLEPEPEPEIEKLV